MPIFMGFRRHGGWLAKDVWDVLRAATPRHLDLRNRLVRALVFTLIVDVVGSVAVFFAERDAPSTRAAGEMKRKPLSLG